MLYLFCFSLRCFKISPKQFVKSLKKIQQHNVLSCFTFKSGYDIIGEEGASDPLIEVMDQVKGSQTVVVGTTYIGSFNRKKTNNRILRETKIAVTPPK